MERQAEINRGIHLWVIGAENWDLSVWRKNLKGAPFWLLHAARLISLKDEGEKERLLGRATRSPADSVEDYVRYEIMADLSMLTQITLMKMVAAIELNEVEGEPFEEGDIKWSEIYHD